MCIRDRTHTVWNVLIAMVFRVAAGSIAACRPLGKLRLVISGPVGTACARLVLAATLNVPALPLLAAAVPGMIFTAVCAVFLYPIFRRVVSQSGHSLDGRADEDKSKANYIRQSCEEQS